MTKILQVISNSDLGGAQGVLYSIVKYSNAKDFEFFVASGTEGPLLESLRKLGVDVVLLPSLKRRVSLISDVITIFHIVKVIREKEVDIVHLHSSKIGVLGRIAGVLANVPIVYTVHGWSFKRPYLFNLININLIVEKLLSRIKCTLVFVSNDDRDLAIAKNLEGKSANYVVHNCIPDSQYKKSYSKVAPQVVMIARFSEQKDHKTLLVALSLIEDLNFKFSLLGDGPKKSEVIALVDELGLNDKLDFLINSNNVQELLPNMDIGVLASKWEGLPLTIIEYMRAGIPVVSTDTGGVSELFSNGVEGILVESGNAAELSKHIRFLLRDEQARKRMGENGRVRFEKNFRVEHMINAYTKIYQSELVLGKVNKISRSLE